MLAGPIIRRRPLADEPDQLPTDLHPVLRRIYLSRGITRPGQLDLGLAGLQPPNQFNGMALAAARVAEAVQSRQKILIVADFDADGATGAALAVRALRAMGCTQVTYLVPDRFEFGYGLSEPLVHSIPGPGPDLLITVDNGISSIRGVAAAAERGIPVIITDHHVPGDQLPAAQAIVNPNLPGDPFPSKNLAGVGVMFYLLLNVRKCLRDAGWFSSRPEPNLASLLDLVALGTVADLVALDHNNRILVAQGLERIRRGACVTGIQALLHVSDRHFGRAQAADLGYAVGPRLNAAGRLKDISVGIECLLTDDLDQAKELAGQLDTLNRQRQQMQSRMQDEALQIVSDMLAELSGSDLPTGLCLYRPDWHQGVVGLVASRIKDAVHRPVIALAPEQDGADLLKGSARSIRGVHIRDVLAALDASQPGLMASFGGHAMAAGLAIKRDRLDQFGSAFCATLEQFVSADQLTGVIETDGELAGSDINLDFTRTLNAAGPWGQHCPEPLFEGRFAVLEQRVVGDKHLKMQVQPEAGGDPVDAIAFNQLPERLQDGAAAQRFIYRLDENVFRGRHSLQLIIEHIASH